LCRLLVEKLTVPQLVKNSRIFLKAEFSSPSSQQQSSHGPNVLGQILIATSHLCPGLPNGLSFGLPHHNAHESLLPPYVLHASPTFLITSIILRSFLQSPVTSACTPQHPHPMFFLSTMDHAPNNNDSPVRRSVQRRGSTLTVCITTFVRAILV
jgi:hypothetical protein